MLFSQLGETVMGPLKVVVEDVAVDLLQQLDEGRRELVALEAVGKVAHLGVGDLDLFGARGDRGRDLRGVGQRLGLELQQAQRVGGRLDGDGGWGSRGRRRRHGARLEGRRSRLGGSEVGDGRPGDAGAVRAGVRCMASSRGGQLVGGGREGLMDSCGGCEDRQAGVLGPVNPGVALDGAWGVGDMDGVRMRRGLGERGGGGGGRGKGDGACWKEIRCGGEDGGGRS